LVNIKFRTEDKCFKLVPGAELLPYNLDAIKGEKECVICEGEADALSFIEIGYNNVVSVPNGANTNLTYLDDYWDDYFEDKETVYIASDSDTKGVLLREELLRRFGPERCRIVEYGEGCKDANEHLVMYGKDSLIECVKNAPEPKIEGIFTTSDIEDSLDAIYESGLKRGYTIGVEGVDKLPSLFFKPNIAIAPEIAPHVPFIQPIPRPKPSHNLKTSCGSISKSSAKAHATACAQLYF
jgi:twinkle protein